MCRSGSIVLITGCDNLLRVRLYEISAFTFQNVNSIDSDHNKLSSLTSNPSYLLTEILDQKTILDHKIILKAETNVSCTMGSLRLTAKDEEIG